MNFLLVTAASIAVLIFMHGITFAVGRHIGRYNVVDVTWGLGFVGVGAVAAVFGSGDLFRRILLFVLVAVWGLRLAWHMIQKSAGTGEDPRYEALMRGDFSAGRCSGRSSSSRPPRHGSSRCHCRFLLFWGRPDRAAAGFHCRRRFGSRRVLRGGRRSPTTRSSRPIPPTRER